VHFKSPFTDSLEAKLLIRQMALIALLLTTFAVNAADDDAASFFDDSQVKEIRLYFSDPNWYNLLYQAL